MLYHVLTQRGTVLARSIVQWVTNIELDTSKVKGIFKTFDQIIASKFKTNEYEYDEDRPNSEDWADLIAENEEFDDKLEEIFSNDDIKEADDHYTGETLDDT